MIDHEHAVEVIGLVLHGDGEEAVGLELEGLAVGVLGADGDAQDALILGARGPCPRGSVHELPVRACIRFVDDGFADDKWVCSSAPVTRAQELALVAFFRFYGVVKLAHDRVRGKRAPTGYRGFRRVPTDV